jgi:hypothetical protein
MKKFKKYNYHNHIIIIANKSVNIFDVLYDIRIEYLNKKITFFLKILNLFLLMNFLLIKFLLFI